MHAQVHGTLLYMQLRGVAIQRAHHEVVLTPLNLSDSLLHSYTHRLNFLGQLNACMLPQCLFWRRDHKTTSSSRTLLQAGG